MIRRAAHTETVLSVSFLCLEKGKHEFYSNHAMVQSKDRCKAALLIPRPGTPFATPTFKGSLRYNSIQVIYSTACAAEVVAEAALSDTV